jgi:hypothetical protein
MQSRQSISSLELPPTEGQVRTISRFRATLGIREQIEERLANRAEAKRVQYGLYRRLTGMKLGFKDQSAVEAEKEHYGE